LGLGFEHGGIAMTFKALLPALEAAGYEVKILAAYADEVANYDIPPAMVVGAAFPHRVRNRFVSRLFRVFHWLTGWRLYFALAKKIPHDAFIVYGASLAPEWVRYSKRPTWGILHSIPHMRLDTPLASVMRRQLRQFSREYAGVFAATPPMCEAWRTVGISSEVLVMPDPFLRFDGPHTERPLPTSELRIRVVCVGRLSWEKGQDMLIKALPEVPCVDVAFVGDGDWQRYLESLAVELGVRERVSFVGWRDDPMIEIDKANLLVNCSRTEAGSLSIREALFSGVPVLATDCPGNRWSLADGRWGRIVPMSGDGIAEGLRHVCEDFSWCLPNNGFGEIRAAMEKSQRQTLDFVCSFDWTKSQGK